MDRKALIALLSDLLVCQAPPGEEGEIDALLQAKFAETSAHVWQDDATNVLAHLPGAGPKVMVCAHKDELGMAVTEVQSDGRLRVENCGGSRPWKYGEGPVDLLADDGSIIRGILSIGSVHTDTGPVHELDRNRALTWDMMSVFTGLTPAELRERGIHVGSRAVVARERKHLQRLGAYIASYALDDRMGLTSLIAALEHFDQVAPNDRPDLYFVATHGEEIGFLGAIYAAQILRPDLCIALDTSPVAHGTPLVLDPRPVVWYREKAYHNKAECDALLQIADTLGFGAQPCLYAASGSDAGRIKDAGLAGRTVCFGFARDNSHGFEIAHADSLVHVTELLIAYLNRQKPRAMVE